MNITLYLHNINPIQMKNKEKNVRKAVRIEKKFNEMFYLGNVFWEAFH